MTRRPAGFCAAVFLTLFAAGATAASPLVLVPSADYPDGVTVGKPRTVVVAFRLNADGRATDCRVAKSSRERRLDAETCAIVHERARFAPTAGEQRLSFQWAGRGSTEALGARGDALLVIAGEWISHADYPDDAVRSEVSGAVGYEVDVSDRGRPLGCRVIESSASKSLDETTCRLVLERSIFIPASDGQGGVRRGVYRSRVRWTIM